MIAFLIARGLSPLVSKLIAYVGVPLLVILFLWWRIDAYGDRRFDAGANQADARWQEASNRLQAEAANSATRADDAAANRLEQFQNQVADERQALDEANRTGTSPLDVLFGG
jgi:hypothetical protein